MADRTAAVRAIIHGKGGKLLKGPYVKKKGAPARVDLVCAEGHQWSSQAGHIKNGSWCAKCHGNAPHKIEDMKAWAAALGGECLAQEYQGLKAKYAWRCGSCTHEWVATYNNVKNHLSWCPRCNSSAREQVTRSAFKENFPGESFDTDRDRIGMELDGYSSALKLAFECDGIQHRVETPHFHRTTTAFEGQRSRDLRKNELCGEAGILLLRVPDKALLPLKNIRSYVRDLLEKHPFELPTTLPTDAEFYAGVQIARSEKGNQYVAAAREIVAGRGGEMLNVLCPTRTWVLQVRCAHGHKFGTHYDNLVRNRWCPECHPAREKSEQEYANLVAEMDTEFAFVSTGIRACKDKPRRYIEATCPIGDHGRFSQRWSNFKRKPTCPKCVDRGARRRMKTETIRPRLEALGLTLEGEYASLTAKSVFVCAAATHRFTTSLKVAELAGPGNCCPPCVIAAMEHSELLSEYSTETKTCTKLRWRCATCGNTTETPFGGMRRRKHPCKKCKI